MLKEDIMATCLFNAFSKGSTVDIFVLFLIGFILLSSVPAPAQDANTLAKDAGKELRLSQSMMFNRKLEKAQSHLNAAAELIEKLKSADPAHKQLKSLEWKYAKQKKDLDKRLPKSKSAKTDKATQAKKTSASGKADKLPGGVTFRLKKVDKILQNGDRVLAKKTVASEDGKVEELEYIITQANDMMAEIQKSYGDQIPPAHPDIKAREDRIAMLKNKVNEFKGKVADKKVKAAEEKKQREADSQKWLARIKPFITGQTQPGYDKTKYLIASGTADVGELKKRKKIYDEAAALFAEYKKAEFPVGKTDELERAEKDLAYALSSFSEGYASSVGNFFKNAEENLEQATKWLTKEEAKDDGKRQPLLLQKDIIPNIKKMIATAAASTSEDDPRVSALNKKLAEIEKIDNKLHQLRTERTFMKPDKFKGKERRKIKTKAAEFLKKEHPGVKVLRTTVISNDWKEERVLEHTDTTKTAVRYRITRSVTAQIAGKRGGDVFLYTIDVSKDKRTDRSWGGLYGHVMFIDPMLEKNVKKQQKPNNGINSDGVMPHSFLAPLYAARYARC